MRYRDPTVPPKYPRKDQGPLRREIVPPGLHVEVIDLHSPEERARGLRPTRMQMYTVDFEEAARKDPGRYKLA